MRFYAKGKDLGGTSHSHRTLEKKKPNYEREGGGKASIEKTDSLVNSRLPPKIVKRRASEGVCPCEAKQKWTGHFGANEKTENKGIQK